MRGRNRPAAEKARAVGIAVMTSGAEASRQTGIPERTIYQWMESEEFAALRTRKKEEVAEEWWAGIQTAARSIFRGLEDAPLRDRAVAFGILVEKMLLVRGGATTRSEVTTFRDYNDHERQRISELLDGVLEGGAEGAPAGVPAGDSAEVR